MTIKKEINLNNFEFWSGAKVTADYLSSKELEQIESTIEELYPDGIDETSLNDLFWFEDDYIAQLLGYESFKEIMNERKDK